MTAANPHARSAATAGVALEDAAGVAVMVHGRGHGPATMDALARLLACDGVHYVLPAAEGGSWYPGRYFDPVAANEPSLGWALDALAAHVRRLEAAGWPPERIALVGFSQGACLAVEYAARHPRRYGAIACLTGALIGSDEEIGVRGDLTGTPVLITTKEQDAWLSPEHTRASADLLRDAGARVDLRIYPGDEHSVTDDEVAAVRALVRAASREPEEAR